MTLREIREHIFKIVFMTEFNTAEEMEEQINLYLSAEEMDGVEEAVKEKIGDKARKTMEFAAEADELINKYAKGWQTRRMAKTDLSIIRLAVYEIRHDDDVPDKVAINEAVELAKSFGGNDSPAFVNGILGKIVREEV